MGTYGPQIFAAWKAKELLRDLLGLGRQPYPRHPDRSTISAARHRFFACVADHATRPNSSPSPRPSSRGGTASRPT
ncbi:hypothetical protein OG568_50055 (plasmid) [Streptomyces sp. NBC_01450]|uniref:hypothetical protein n=1 Tax=Streptomyces sp. NBC_01450 TaxID=2903871 RepID=UPI002E36D176|nr:hypothetical protein [Streptomyces sp. NBC_01450]